MGNIKKTKKESKKRISNLMYMSHIIAKIKSFFKQDSENSVDSTLLNKDLDDTHINMILSEVKDSMKGTCESANTLDQKAHSIIKITISIIFGLSTVVFISKDDKTILLPSGILITGAFVALFILCFSYKTRTYHLYGDLMQDINTEDNYYKKDSKGTAIYLIQTYQIKALYNAKINRIRGSSINWAIIIIIISAFISFAIFLKSLFKCFL